MDIDVSKDLLSRIKEAGTVDQKVFIIEIFLEELVRSQVNNKLAKDDDEPTELRKNINEAMNRLSELATLTSKMGMRETKLASEILALHNVVNKLSEIVLSQNRK